MKLIFQLAVIIISGAIYAFYISPMGAEVKTLSSEVSKYNEVLEKSKELKIQRDKVLAEFNSLTPIDLDRLNKSMPDTFNAVLFANELSFIGSQHGMLVRDLKMNEENTNSRDAIINPSSDPYKTTKISFRVTGSYSQFLKFLNSIEKSLRIMDVTGLTLRAIGGRGLTDSSYEYLLEIDTYSLR